jgi:hypothetical protein
MSAGMFSADFRGQKDDPAPIALHHARQIGPRQADAGHDVDLEEPRPFAVRDLEEILRAEDAEIVHEDVGGGLGGHQGRAALRCAEIGGDATDHGPGHRPPQRRDRGINAGLAAAVHDHPGAGLGETLGDGKADACGRARDDRGLVGQVDLHGMPHPSDGFTGASFRGHSRHRL